LIAGCSVYTDALLKPGNAGNGGSAGSGGDGQTQSDGGRPSNQGGVDNRGAKGAMDPGGSAGTSSGTGTAAGMGGVPDAVGGEGGRAEPVDECPDDQEKVEPGACGCGVPESCVDLRDALLHRYSFETAGAVATDSIGGEDATIVGTAAAGGAVVFDGTSDAYVDLPNEMISALGDASFEIWATWAGGSGWQRLFDFGDNNQGEDEQGTGETYLYLTPQEGVGDNVMRASFTTNGIDGESSVRASAALPTTTRQHVALVVDDTNNELRLYLNGELSEAFSSFNGSLSQLNDVNNWLGRSNYTDPPLGGSIEEFRIYGVALTDAQVSASASFGPNPSFL
jgi:hypothetical protein